MAELWGATRRACLWRHLWIVLAEEQQAIGLRITDEQLNELREFRDRPNLDVAARYEREKRHDVMAHVHAYGDQCPSARAIIHWGATSCYVTDNADLILFREAMSLIQRRLESCIEGLTKFARDNASLPCLAFTHLQPAQPTTVGKRACLWAYDLVLDWNELQHRLATLKCRSIKRYDRNSGQFLAIVGWLIMQK